MSSPFTESVVEQRALCLARSAALAILHGPENLRWSATSGSHIDEEPSAGERRTVAMTFSIVERDAPSPKFIADKLRGGACMGGLV